MKKIFLFALVLATVGFVSCDPKEKDTDKTPTPTPTPVDELKVDTIPTNKKVLLEEYTGKTCGYCPDGHKRANALMEANPGNVFVINIHEGSYASGTPNYKTSFGAALMNQTGLTGFPSGTINRHVFKGGAMALNRGEWATYAAQVIAEPSYVNIAALATIDTDNRKVQVRVKVYYTSDAVNVNNLNIAVIQDSIIGPQSGASTFYPAMGTDNAYQHNHMLRHLITGQWGEAIDIRTKGTLYEKTFLWDVPADLNSIPLLLEKLKVIAFIAEDRKDVVTACESQIKYGKVE